jgi:UDP-glucose 4-epimerase
VWVYSDVEAESVDEETPLRHPSHLYSATKLAGELYCRSYTALYDVECTVLRFGIPYGPRARPAAVVPSFVQRALAGEPLTIAGAGEQSRRFVYVEDLAEGIVSALAPVAANRTYNLVGETDTSIREVAAAVQDAVGGVEIVHTEGRPGDFGGVVVSGERAAAELGWRARTPFSEGVRRYVEWYRDEHRAPAAAAPSPLVVALRASSRSVAAFAVGAVALLAINAATGSELVHALMGLAAALALIWSAVTAATGPLARASVWLTSGFVFGWFLADVPDAAHGAMRRMAWLLLGVCAMVAANAVARRAARSRLEREPAP